MYDNLKKIKITINIINFDKQKYQIKKSYDRI